MATQDAQHESMESPAGKRGLPPGSLIHVGEPRPFSSRVTVIDFNLSHYQENEVTEIETLVQYRHSGTTTWIHVAGVHDTRLIQQLGDAFAIHPLVLEDIMNTEQRPKLEDYGDYLFVVIKNVQFEEAQTAFVQDQISMVLMDGLVVTFSERDDSLFAPLQRRLRESGGRIRGLGSDFLAYSVLDIVVDHYFLIADNLDPVFETLEDELISRATRESLIKLQKIKREMSGVRRGIGPMREMLAMLLRSESPLIQERTRIYLQDVYDHAIRVSESLESYRDLAADMLDIYLSSVSNRMNEVMKVLTVFATIFIPLTFLVGVYGMNFDYMPELHWRWSYPVLWGGMLAIIVGMLSYFRRKKWL